MELINRVKTPKLPSNEEKEKPSKKRKKKHKDGSKKERSKKSDEKSSMYCECSPFVFPTPFYHGNVAVRIGKNKGTVSTGQTITVNNFTSNSNQVPLFRTKNKGSINLLFDEDDGTFWFNDPSHHHKLNQEEKEFKEEEKGGEKHKTKEQLSCNIGSEMMGESRGKQRKFS